MTPDRSLAAFVVKSVTRPQAPRLRISMAGNECERYMYLAATGADGDPEKPESLVKMAIGTALDKYALPEATVIEDDGLHRAFQVPVKIRLSNGFVLSGSADAVLFAERSDTWTDKTVLDYYAGETGVEFLGDARRVEDLKTVGGKTWTKVKSQPKWEHLCQVSVYAHGLGAPEWLICYKNASTGEAREFSGPVDPLIVKQRLGKFERVSAAMNSKQVPPIAAGALPQSFPCGWKTGRCKFWRHCWDNNATASLDAEEPGALDIGF